MSNYLVVAVMVLVLGLAACEPLQWGSDVEAQKVLVCQDGYPGDRIECFWTY